MQTYHKYSGAGNTFLIFEDFEENFPLNQIPSLCYQNTDGLMLARRSNRADFQMIYFNSDGSIGEMCGNGLRCFVHFLRDVGHLKNLYRVEVSGKVLTVKCKGERISTFLPWPSQNFEQVLLENTKGYKVNTGVPHLVVFTEIEVDVAKIGSKLRNHSVFQPEGVNVNFVHIEDRRRLHIHTYERGVERETLACGTGAVAAVVIANGLGKCDETVTVVPRSKECLEVHLGKEIEVIGPSKKISEGSVSEEACTSFQKKI